MIAEIPTMADESSDVDSSDIDSSIADESSESDVDSSVADDSNDDSDDHVYGEPLYNIHVVWEGLCNTNSADPLSVDEDGTLTAKRKDIVLDLMSAVDSSYTFNGTIMFTSSANSYYDLFEENHYANITKNLYISGSRKGTIPLSSYFYTERYIRATNNVKNRTQLVAIVIAENYKNDVSSSMSYMESKLKASGIKLCFVDLREGHDDLLEHFANCTNGQYLKYTDENMEYLKNLVSSRSIIG